MKTKSQRFGCIAFGFLTLAGILVLIAILLYFPQRIKAIFSRPLVLVHSPVNGETLEVGEGIVVHATARNEKGISRAELWIDNTLVSMQSAPDIEDGVVNPLVLSTDWQPTTAGEHTILVRAYSNDQVPGQGTIQVIAHEADEIDTLISHTVEEGDTLESIAEEFGTSPEEISELNPDLPAGGPAPGDAIDVPAGGELSDGEPAPEPASPAGEDATDEETLPLPEGDDPAPGDLFEVLELLFNLEIADILASSLEAESTLRMEILSFETEPALEDANCYASLGDGPWDVAELEGASRFFYWPADQPLPFSVECVGIHAGGTDWVDLGLAAMRIPPESWDGTVRRVTSVGGEGSFTVEYRINWEGLVAKDPDPDMTPPTNVHLYDRRSSLRWDYFPRDDEGEINGFRIYLNDNLQWTEPADARESMIPYEWFNPPCGFEYNFTVTAYRLDFDEDSESYHSDPPAIAETPAEGCTRELQITFLTLETFDLGGDGRYEDRSGDIGPPYGTFHANERTFSFDATGSDSYWAGLDVAHGLSHNTTYDLYSMYADPTWGFSGMPSLIVDVPPGGTFEFGYNIMDEDTGRCRDSDDPGCDDLICEGLSLYYNERYGVFDEFHEGSLISENGRCRVTYRWGPASGSPVGSGVDGWEPLPWLSVEDFSIDETTGLMQIEVQNTGSATWPWKDLDIEFRTRAGESLAFHTWPEFVLETGQRTVLEPPIEFSPPYDVCIQIDPFDRVPEGPERSAAMTHNPICPTQADLTITDVHFDAQGGGRIRVTVRNVGDGTVENRTLALETLLPDGSSAYMSGSWPTISLEPRQSRTFDITGANESARERLSGGYTVIVNPEGTISESNTENNSYDVDGAAQLQLFWCNKNIPHVAGLTSAVRMYFTADVVTGESSRRVLDTHWSHSLSGQEVIWGYGHNDRGHPGYSYSCEVASDVFQILGDEALQVNFRSTYRRGNYGDFENIGSASILHLPDRRWEAGTIPPGGMHSSCWDVGGHQVSTDFALGFAEGTWHTRYLVCEVSP